jgi:hypothetical protein
MDDCGFSLMFLSGALFTARCEGLRQYFFRAKIALIVLAGVNTPSTT